VQTQESAVVMQARERFLQCRHMTLLQRRHMKDFCIVLQYVAVCCSVLQCVAVCCSGMTYDPLATQTYERLLQCRRLQCRRLKALLQHRHVTLLQCRLIKALSFAMQTHESAFAMQTRDSFAMQTRESSDLCNASS